MDMAELSPPKRDEPQEEDRAVSLGGLKRVFKSRRKERARALRIAKDRRVGDSDEDSDLEEESDDDDDKRSGPRRSRVQKLSHHYTLNMASPSVAKPDLPYVLLGSVRLLIFFVRMRVPKLSTDTFSSSSIYHSFSCSCTSSYSLFLPFNGMYNTVCPNIRWVSFMFFSPYSAI